METQTLTHGDELGDEQTEQIPAGVRLSESGPSLAVSEPLGIRVQRK